MFDDDRAGLKRDADRNGCGGNDCPRENGELNSVQCGRICTRLKITYQRRTYRTCRTGTKDGDGDLS